MEATTRERGSPTIHSVLRRNWQEKERYTELSKGSQERCSLAGGRRDIQNYSQEKPGVL
jgi:hypothetical protein